MAIHQQTLIDQATGTNRHDFVLTADDLPGTSSGWSLRMRTCHGGRSEGVQLVEIDNGEMTTTVIPTRGMGIWRIRRGDRDLGWQSPVAGPVHPAWVPLFDPSGLGWLEGFDELLCRCGLESNGAPQWGEKGQLEFPLHGRIANLPTSRLDVRIDDSTGTISLVGTVLETRFHFQKLRLTSTLTIPLEGSQITWKDEVTNVGGTPATMQMLYHLNLGRPVLRPGSRLVAPISAMAPSDAVAAERIEKWNTTDASSPGAAEVVYLFDLLADQDRNTRILLRSPDGDEGISLQWNLANLPYFSLWKNCVADQDGYVTGLEPATNFPNPRSFEEAHGRVVKLDPSESWQGQVTLDWHGTATGVAACEDSILALQGNHQPILHNAPVADWSVV